MEIEYSSHSIELLCKGVRGIIYLVALVWLIWFNYSHYSHLKRTKWLIFAGIPFLLLGFFVSLYGEFYHLPRLIKEVLGEVILTNTGITLILASLILLVAEISRISRQHKREAETDPLTGLPNRRVFFLEADRILRDAMDGNCLPSVAILDVDNMKEVNDTKGHQFGDEVLKKVALVIKRSIRECDIAARYGGDEFAVLFPDKGPDIEIFQARLQKNLNEMNEEMENVDLTLSIGLARFPADGLNLDELLSVADTRMYAVKNKKELV